MKRIIALTILALLAFSVLTACSSKKSEEEQLLDDTMKAMEDVMGSIGGNAPVNPPTPTNEGTPTENSTSEFNGIYYSVSDKSVSATIENDILNYNGMDVTITWNGNIGEGSIGALGMYTNYNLAVDGDSLLVTITGGLTGGENTYEYVKEGGKSIIERNLVELNLPLLVEECTFLGGYLSDYISSDGELIKRNNNGSETIDTNVRSICAKGFDNFYIKNDNSLWGYGSNRDGMLGDGTGVDKDSPIKILDGVASVYFNGDSGVAAAIKTDKSLWAWGNGTFAPILITDSAISVSFDRAKGMLVVRKSNGLIYGYKLEENAQGNILTGSPGDAYSSAGGYPNEQIIDWDGTSWINATGVLYSGYGKQAKQIDTNVAKVRGSHYIKTDNTLWGYGDNSNGQLGDGTKVPREDPVKIADNVIAVQGNSYITSNGELWVWDANNPTPQLLLTDVYSFVTDGVLLNNGEFIEYSNEYGERLENVKLPETINFSN